MRQIHLSTLLVIIATGSLFAQNISGGLKFGLNSSTIKYIDDDGSSKNNARISLHGGFYAVFKFNDKVGLQPEFIISSEGDRFEIGNNDGSTRLTYLNIPILLRYQVVKGFHLLTGPQIGALLGARYELDGNTVDVKDNMNGLALSWAFGAGFDFPGKWNAGIRYNVGLSDVFDDNNSDNKRKVSTLQLSVGYRLF